MGSERLDEDYTEFKKLHASGETVSAVAGFLHSLAKSSDGKRKEDPCCNHPLQVMHRMLKVETLCLPQVRPVDMGLGYLKVF